MQRIHRYLLRQCIEIMAGLTLLIVGILMLERLFRIADILSQSPGQLSQALTMIASLVPHYLGIALPAAFFLAVLLTINRVSRSGELVTMWGAGVSLVSISRPFMLMSTALVALYLVVTGIAQPLARFEYRKTISSLAQTNIETMFQEGKFIVTDQWIVWTDGVDRGGGNLKDSFILELGGDGMERIIVAASGQLVRQGKRVSEIKLDAGMGANVKEGRQEAGRVEFESLIWRVPDLTESHRPRGGDARELTLTELAAVSQRRVESDVEQVDAHASFHDQISRAILFLILPLLAIPLGLDYGRKPTTNSVLIGLMILITIQKSMEFGKTLNAGVSGHATFGSWSMFAIFAVLSIALYARSAFTMAQPPLASIPRLRLPGFLTGAKDDRETGTPPTPAEPA